MPESYSVQAILSAKDSGFSSAFKNALSATDSLTSKLKSGIGFGVLTGIGQKAVGAITSGVSNMTKGVVQSGMEFESTMSTVKAISGATAAEMEKLTQKAKEMGATTKFTATDAAEAFKYMGMAGWNAGQMTDGLPGILNLAAAAQTDLGTTSDIVTDGLTAFGKTASDAARFSDVLAAAATSTNTDVVKMGETFKYVGPVCGTLGASMEDASVMAGLMANAGIKSTQSGTAMRRGLQNLIDPTDEMKAAMEKYGFSIQTTSDGSVDLMGTMKNLRTSLAGASKTEKAAALSAIFGANAFSGWAAVANASEEDFNKVTEAIYNSKDAAATMAAIQMDNLEGDVLLLSSAYSACSQTIYDKLNPAMRSVVQIGTDALTALNEKLEGLDFSGLASRITGFAQIFRSAFKTEGVWTAFADAFNAIKQSMTDGTSKVRSFTSTIHSLAGKLKTVAGFLKDHAQEIGSLLKILPGLTAAYMGFSMMPNMSGLLSAVGIVESGISSIVSGFAGLPKMAGTGIASFGKSLSKLIPTSILGKMSSLSASVRQFGLTMSAVAKGSLGIWAQSGSKIAGVFQKLAPAVTAAGGQMISGLSSMMNLAMRLIAPAALVGIALAGLGILYQKFGGQIDQFLQMAAQKGPQIITNLANGISSRLPGLIQSGAQLVAGLANTLTANIPAIIQAGVSIVGALVQGVGNSLPTLIPAAVNLVTTLAQGILGALPQLLAIGMNLLLALAQGIVSNLPLIIQSAVNTVTSFIQGISQNLPNILNTAVQIVQTLLTGIVQNLPAIISGGMEIVGALAGGLLRNLPTIVSAGAKLIWSLGKGIVQAIPEILGGIVKGIGSLFSSLWKFIKGGGTDTTQLMNESFQEMESNFGNITRGMAGDFGNATSSMTGSFSTATTNMSGSLGNFSGHADAAFSGISQSASTMSGNVSNAISYGIADSLSAYDRMQEQATSTMQGTVEAVSTDAWAMGDRINSAMSSVSTTGLENLTTSLTTGTQAATESVSANYEAMASSISSNMEQVNSASTAGLETMQSSYQTTFDAIKSIVTESMEQIRSSVEAGLQAVNQILAEMVSAIPGLSTGMAALASSFSNLAATAPAVSAGLAPVAQVAGASSAAIAQLATGAGAAATSISALTGAFSATASGAQSLASGAQAAQNSLAGLVSASNNAQAGLSKLGAAGTQAMNQLTTAFRTAATQASTLGKQIGNNLLNGVKSGLNKLPSAATSAMSKFTSAIRSGGAKAVSVARSAASSIVSALRSASSGAHSAGVAIGSGLASGMSSQLGRVRSIAAQLAAAANAAIRAKAKIHSPSKVTKKTGGYIGLGLAKGLASKTGVVTTAAEKLAKKALKALSAKTSTNKGGYKKAAEKLAKSYKNSLTSTMNANLKSAKNLINNSLLKTKGFYDVKKVKKTIKKGNKKLKKVTKSVSLSKAGKKMSTKLYDTYSKYIKKETDKAIAATESSLSKLGEKFQKQYDAVIEKRTAFYNTLSNVGDLYTADDYGYIALKDFKGATAQIKQYSKNIEKLKKTLPDGLMEEILKLDTAKGLELTNSLLGMSSKQLKAWGKDYSAFIKAAKKTSNTYYQPQLEAVRKAYNKAVTAEMKALNKKLDTIGQNAVQGFINGMTKQMKSLKGNSKKLAQTVVKVFKSELKIHSPSRVLLAIGKFTGQGFVNGLDRMASRAEDAMANLVTLPDVQVPSIRVPALAGGPGGSGGEYELPVSGGEFTIVVPVILEGREIARVTAKYDAEEQAKLQRREDRRRGRN